METTMEEQHRVVQEWLERVFTGESVPDYEITESTVGELWLLATRSKEKERKMEEVVKDVEQKAQEYAVEIERMKSVLDWVGVSESDLSTTGQNYARSLTGSALTLGIADSSDASFCLSLTELAERQAALMVREGELEREKERIETELRREVLTQATQKQALGEFSQQLNSEAEAVHRQQKSADFFAKKSIQYQKHISTMKTELEQAGYEDSLSHASLLQSSKEIEELRTKLDPLKTQLASFQGLPPDIELARVKVEGAKRELVRLEVELSRCLDLVHT